MSKVIVHIDLNAFFARAEEIRDPSLENKPVAIGHNGRAGVVSTCSYKAREYGVRSAMQMKEALRLCPHLIIIPGDYRYYSALSETFTNFVRKYTKIVEKASVDEVYADFTDVLKNVKNPELFFKDFQNKLFKETKLKCSIGVGPTKFLAKMASDYKKPMGITIIRRRDIEKILYPISINDLYGVGKKSAPRLISVGINTVGDLAKALNEDNEDVYNIIGKFSHVLKEWLNGYGDDKVMVEEWDPKSIGNSTTFKEDTQDYEVIKEYFKYLAREVSDRAKKESKLGNCIQIMVKDTSYVAHNKSITFGEPTNDYQTILNYAIKLFDKNYTGIMLRACGVTLQNLVSPQDLAVQMTFFDYEKHEEENKTKLLINEFNRKLGTNNLKRASEVKKDGSSRRN